MRTAQDQSVSVARRLGFFALAAIAAFSISACSSTSDTASQDIGYPPGGAAEPGFDEGMGALDMGKGAIAPITAPDSTDVIVTGSADIQTDDPAAAAASFQDELTRLGGRVSDSTIDRTGDQPIITITARVPAKDYQTLVDGLSEFGTVVHQNTTAQDVGQQVADLQARQNVLEASILRLTELMATATTTADLLAAEEQLAARQAELDSLNAQLKWFDDQTTMSTLYVTFAADDAGFPSPPANPLQQAWDYFLNSLEYILYAAVIALPWAALAVLAFFGVRWYFRRRRRTRV